LVCNSFQVGQNCTNKRKIHPSWSWLWRRKYFGLFCHATQARSTELVTWCILTFALKANWRLSRNLL
jgi:hypothetical protein